ncbi:MAG TPA: GTP cyclohydrolase I, partial [Solirubrobacteraceae bacterium]|nr:GTP cyclohydrolase I [Solirubrobacteraceae bacterium]
MAAAYAELLAPEPFSMTTFPNDGGYDELVVVREIPFHSLCMHHLLPFHGVAHLAYLPGERIIGVVIEAEHLCMSLRGVRKPGTRTTTSALLGLLRDD